MGIQFAQLAAKTAMVTVAYEDQTATIVYRPNAITPMLIQRVQGNQQDITTLTDVLSQLIVEWDVMGSPPVPVNETTAVVSAISTPETMLTVNPGMYPTNAHALGYLPLGFISAVTEAVFGAVSPNSRMTAAR